MSTTTELHQDAMRHAEQAELAWWHNHNSKALFLARRAFARERAAALQCISEGAEQPSTAVLLRSAAWLALECGEVQEARRLAQLGLARKPPPKIADELRDVLDAINERTSH